MSSLLQNSMVVFGLKRNNISLQHYFKYLNNNRLEYIQVWIGNVDSGPSVTKQG